MLLAASIPSAAKEGEDAEARMMAMTASLAVSAAGQAAPLATATLAPGAHVSVITGLTPATATATTSTAPSTTSAPPPLPSL